MEVFFLYKFLVKLRKICYNRYKIKIIKGGVNFLDNFSEIEDLINKKEVAPLLKGLIDTVSISLNAPTAKKFYEITKSKFGIESYDAMKKFAVSCKSYIPNVVFTVVDCIGEEDIKASQKICDDLGIKLRVRPFE